MPRGLIDYANSSVGADNTVDHIELTSSAAFPIDLAYRNINGQLERQQYNAMIGGEWSNDKWKFDGRVNYARGEVQNDEKNSTATIFGLPRLIVDYTGSEGAPNFSFPGVDTTNGALVNQIAAVFNPRNNNQEEDGAQFNVEFKPEIDWLPSIKTGIEQRTVTMESLLHARTIQLSSRTPTPASAGATTTVAVGQSVIAGIVDNNSGTNDVPFFDTGDLGFGGGIKFWNDNGDPTYEATIAASGLTMDPYGRERKSGHQRDVPELPRHLVGGRGNAGRIPAGIFRIRQFRRAGECIAGCALLRHEHAVGGLQPGTAGRGYHVPDSFPSRWLHGLVAVTQSSL